MMSKQSRKEYLEEVRLRYFRMEKKEKKKILDDTVSFTKYNRKYVIRKLSSRESIFIKDKPPRKERKKKYGSEVIIPLMRIWEVLDYPCSVRLYSQIPIMLKTMEKYQEVIVSKEVKEKLLSIQPRTIDRRLKKEREVRRIRNKRNFATTKPGTLKSKIPIRTGTEWNEDKPGFEEIDTVAHNGGDPSGTFVYTLVSTDVYSGWTENVAGLGKSKKVVIEKGLVGTIVPDLPFRLRGVDGDSGSEIINDLLYYYCRRSDIVFTRSRPNHSNDGCHIEEKNWTHVRKIVGYGRLDTQKEVDNLNNLYRNELRLYMNFFQPHMKCIEKKYLGSKVKKKYEIKTPYQHLIDSSHTTKKEKLKLKEIYQDLNPVYLKREIDKKKRMISKIFKK